MTTPYLKGAANTHVAFLHKHSTRNSQECKLRLKHHTCYVLHYFKLPPLQLTYFWTWFWQPYPNILFWHSWHSFDHSLWHILSDLLANISADTLSDLSCDILQLLLWPLFLGSSTPHSTSNIAVGVQRATLNSQYRGWGPARHTPHTISRLGSSTPHWTRNIAVGVQHATLNWEDASCNWGPARHTELRGSQLPLGSSTPHWTQRIPANWGGRRRRRGRGGEEGGGEEETDIKSNNPHLTGGEIQLEFETSWST